MEKWLFKIYWHGLKKTIILLLKYVLMNINSLVFKKMSIICQKYWKSVVKRIFFKFSRIVYNHTENTILLNFIPNRKINIHKFF